MITNQNKQQKKFNDIFFYRIIRNLPQKIKKGYICTANIYAKTRQISSLCKDVKTVCSEVWFQISPMQHIFQLITNLSISASPTPSCPMPPLTGEQHFQRWKKVKHTFYNKKIHQSQQCHTSAPSWIKAKYEWKIWLHYFSNENA